MTDRDTFAAAALPFVARRGLTDEQVAAHCYKWADVMLRERGTAVSDNCVTGNQREMECPQPTLTDEEREAVKLAADFLEDEFYGCSDKCAAEHSAVATLRKLLERLK